MAKILLVDDSEANRDMLARRLQRKGHEVLVAGDGRQAIAMTKSEMPDLVLMDLNLPGLDGWSATRQLKGTPETRAIPVIALTAHAMSEDRHKALQAGCDDYQIKPVDFRHLLSRIDALSPSKRTETPPESIQQELPTAPTPDTRQPATVAGHILVVDDTEANRDMVARRLERNGFTVDIAPNGSLALDLIKAKKYHAVVLDVMMPGISGLDVLRTIRQSQGPAELPVIMATARGESQAIVEALRLGANDYVTKPLDFPVLLARLRTHLELKSSVEQIRALEHGLQQRNAQLEAVNARMRGDLTAAAKVQAALLPVEGPPVQDYRFSWLFQPSAGLAGDILNVFALDDEHVGLYVLDVSGHGVAAALLSVTVSRFLSPTPDPSSLLWRKHERAFALEEPAVVGDRLGRKFPIDQTTGQYFTMVYGLLSTTNHQLRYISAGHPNLIHIPFEKEPRIVEASGYPIGVAPPGPENYDEYRLDIAPGDRLVIHSDGVNEAMSPSGQMFDVSRILELLAQARNQPLDQCLKLLSARIDEWTGHGERRDDQTVLAIERLRDS